MNKFSGRLPIYLVSLAAIFIVLFGIRATAPILNPILLAMVITITVLPIPGHLTRRGLPGWLALVLTILVVVLVLALVIATVFFSVTKLATELPTYLADATATASQEMPSEATGLEASVSTTESTSPIGADCSGLHNDYPRAAGPIWDGFVHLLLHDQRGDIAARSRAVWVWTRVRRLSAASAR